MWYAIKKYFDLTYSPTDEAGQAVVHRGQMIVLGGILPVVLIIAVIVLAFTEA